MKLAGMIYDAALLCAVLNLMAGVSPAVAALSTPPTRDPGTPGYVNATELPDGVNPPADADGNFIIGPTHNRAPEMTVQEGVPHGMVYHITMNSADSKIYPGIAREAHTFGTVDPTDPAKLVVTTSYPAPYTRQVAVYVPPNNTSPAPSRPSWSARTDPTGCRSRFWTI
jgi:iron(III)-enterobactin esterase